VADGSSGLQIIDISDPTSPSLTGLMLPLAQANGVYVSGKYAYVADEGSGLQISTSLILPVQHQLYLLFQWVF